MLFNNVQQNSSIALFPARQGKVVIVKMALTVSTSLTKAQVEICHPGSYSTKIECDGIWGIDITLNLVTEHTMYTFHISP